MAIHDRRLDILGSAEWARAINASFFAVSTTPLTSKPFSAGLNSWLLGDVRLSLHRCDPVRYCRENTHIGRNDTKFVLVTIPVTTRLRFRQDNRELACGPGSFFLQLGDREYEFIQEEVAEMWSLRIPESLLRTRLLSLDNYAPYAFDAKCGAGALLVDLIKAIPERIAGAGAVLASRLGAIIVDLLVLALESDAKVLAHRLGSAQQGHMARIEHHIRRNLSDPSITPESIAAACGISLRYLHSLFNGTDTTVSRWILDLRLDACHEDLRAGQPRRGVSEIAFRWGFSDHAHFSRQYKRRFGLTPRERRLAVTG